MVKYTAERLNMKAHPHNHQEFPLSSLHLSLIPLSTTIKFHLITPLETPLRAGRKAVFNFNYLWSPEVLGDGSVRLARIGATLRGVGLRKPAIA